MRTTLLAFVAVLAGACAPNVWSEPYPVYPVALPRDDAAHDAPVEWWYWVGHVEDDTGARLAFQLTFFRAYAPPEVRLGGVVPMAWLVAPGHVAHVAVTDLDAGEHAMGQRFDAYYGGSASTVELGVSVGDWRATRAEDGVSHALSFTVGGYAFDLVLTPTKPAALHGDPPGIQTMGPGGVSYYVAHTRMAAEGTVRGPCLLPRACRARSVQGQAWFDHQWGDFRIDADGRHRTLADVAFEIVPTGATWTSPDTGAVEVTGTRPGVGFVELTNYDRLPFDASRLP